MERGTVLVCCQSATGFETCDRRKDVTRVVVVNQGRKKPQGQWMRKSERSLKCEGTSVFQVRLRPSSGVASGGLARLARLTIQGQAILSTQGATSVLNINAVLSATYTSKLYIAIIAKTGLGPLFHIPRGGGGCGRGVQVLLRRPPRARKETRNCRAVGEEGWGGGGENPGTFPGVVNHEFAGVPKKPVRLKLHSSGVGGREDRRDTTSGKSVRWDGVWRGRGRLSGLDSRRDRPEFSHVGIIARGRRHTLGPRLSAQALQQQLQTRFRKLAARCHSCQSQLNDDTANGELAGEQEGVYRAVTLRARSASSECRIRDEHEWILHGVRVEYTSAPAGEIYSRWADAGIDKESIGCSRPPARALAKCLDAVCQSVPGNVTYSPACGPANRGSFVVWSSQSDTRPVPQRMDTSTSSLCVRNGISLRRSTAVSTRCLHSRPGESSVRAQSADLVWVSPSTGHFPLPSQANPCAIYLPANFRPHSFHLRELGSIPDGVAPGFSRVGIVPDDAAGRRVSSEMSRFCPPPSFRSCSTLTSLHPNRLSRPRATIVHISAAESRARKRGMRRLNGEAGWDGGLFPPSHIPSAGQGCNPRSLRVMTPWRRGAAGSHQSERRGTVYFGRDWPPAGLGAASQQGCQLCVVPTRLGE
ncbi:hypothetical protein PR048_029055 [Dryococelus australis]|uniref:Uncharacterized protein n=1 Tax=Dryococelus australis TaxID=614101 RepID=A0ABQ9GFS4_9NEOP|nr:hypothetical protein PR048_029055 [Dryococelus australis]